MVEFRLAVVLMVVIMVAAAESIESSESLEEDGEDFDYEEMKVEGFPSDFSFYDKDGDGKFSVQDMWEALDEEPNSPGIIEAFNLLDIGDGYITEQEFKDGAWRHWLLDLPVTQEGQEQLSTEAEESQSESLEDVAEKVAPIDRQIENTRETKRRLLNRLEMLLGEK